MLNYIHRSASVYEMLKGKFVEREVYDAIEFRRCVKSNISHIFTTPQLVEYTGLGRHTIYKAVDNLSDMGLIEKLPTKRGYWRFRLVQAYEQQSKSIVAVHHETTKGDVKNGTDSPPY